MGIGKLASDTKAFARPFQMYSNARMAFKSFLDIISFAPGEKVLLPAYVGYSVREGSGVFDPVAELELSSAFYKLDSQLHIDLHDFERCLRLGDVRVAVLIHYFGYIDPNYESAVEIARRYGALVLEDEAHALLSDWVGGRCGRLGDAAIFSLHKLLPFLSGGMLSVSSKYEELIKTARWGNKKSVIPWEYDLKTIATCRHRNACELAAMLKPLAGKLEPLWGPPAPNEFPQTFPAIVKQHSRDELYFAMNEAGFGGVSLYHTMIDLISPENYPASHKIAKSIINLPIHQDVNRDDLLKMVNWLKMYFETCSTS
jgi:dTDP-4-amino-4,6-dideoxygalactose transaminase